MNKSNGEREQERKRNCEERRDLHSISNNGTKEEQIGPAVGLAHITASIVLGALWPSNGKQSDPRSAVQAVPFMSS